MKADKYLVCPYNDDEIEAARAGAYKLREEQSLQKTKKSSRNVSSELRRRRKLREEGEFVPDSGIDEREPLLTPEDQEQIRAINDPLLSTQCFRRYYYWQLNREQMQGIVAWYYGWEEWSEDPWGTLPDFWKWQNSARDNEMAVWAVNETLMGRKYLAASALYRLNQIDFSRVTGTGLLDYIGIGAASSLLVKRHTGWELENFADHYPGESLPVGLVNARVNKVYPFDFKLPFEGVTFPLPKKLDGTLDVPERVTREPFEEIEDLVYLSSENHGPAARYRLLISSIYTWYLAMAEAVERAKGNPELEYILSYHAATHAPLADLCQSLAPNGYHLLDKEESFENLEEAKFKVLDGISRSEGWRYTPDEAYSEGLLGLFEGVEYWDDKLEVPETLAALLSGEKEKWIGRSIQKIIRCKFYDKLKEEKPQFVRLLERAKRTEELKGQAGRGISGEVLEEYKKTVPEWEKAPLSLDQMMASERRYEAKSEGETLSFLDTVSSALLPVEKAELAYKEAEADRLFLYKFIEEAGLPKREKFVVDLRREGRKDTEIALAYEKAFNKKTSPGNIRKLHHDAVKKLKRYVQKREERISMYRDATFPSRPTERIPDLTPFKAIMGEEPRLEPKD